MGDPVPARVTRLAPPTARLRAPATGYSVVMNETSPRNVRDIGSSDEDDELWPEAMSALGMIGAVLLLVVVISLIGRL
jgi:hypothetical protein